MLPVLCLCFDSKPEIEKEFRGHGARRQATSRFEVALCLLRHGSIQVPGDILTLPWVRSRIWVGAGLGLGLGLALREGWVDTSPESWIEYHVPLCLLSLPDANNARLPTSLLRSKLIQEHRLLVQLGHKVFLILVRLLDQILSRNHRVQKSSFNLHLTLHHTLHRVVAVLLDRGRAAMSALTRANTESKHAIACPILDSFQRFSPFTPKSDQFQISPAASPQI